MLAFYAPARIYLVAGIIHPRNGAEGMVLLMVLGGVLALIGGFVGFLLAPRRARAHVGHAHRRLRQPRAP